MEARKAVPAVLLSANLLASACGPEPEAKAGFSDAEVACINVEEFAPFTEDQCDELAHEVASGLNYLSELTDGKIVRPQVRSRLLPETVKFKDALDARCTNVNKDNQTRNKKLIFTIADAALKETAGVDLNNTLLVVAVNAPESLCGTDSDLLPGTTGPASPMPQESQRCPNASAETVSYRHAVTLPTEARQSFIVAFKTIRPEFMKIIIAHEGGHANRRQFGHELTVCNKNGDRIPSVIKAQQADLDLYLADTGSLMSYNMNEDAYLAPPHLAYLGVIAKDQIVMPEHSGTFTLRDADKAGPALLQLKLTNPAIKKMIQTFIQPLTEDDKDINVDNFAWFIGKLPDRPALGVYAAPVVGKHASKVPHDFSIPIITLDTHTLKAPGDTLSIEGDMQLEIVDSSNDAIVVNLKKS